MRTGLYHDSHQRTPWNMFMKAPTARFLYGIGRFSAFCEIGALLTANWDILEHEYRISYDIDIRI